MIFEQATGMLFLAILSRSTLDGWQIWRWQMECDESRQPQLLAASQIIIILVIFESSRVTDTMKISAKAEYACIAMTELAIRHQRSLPTSLKVIADAYGISQGFLMQIFMQLKGARFVQSIRGASGGYQLTRAPDAIRLSDIIDVIDGSQTVHSALAALTAAPLAHTLQEIWKETQQAERQILENITLAALIQRAQQSGALDFQI